MDFDIYTATDLAAFGIYMLWDKIAGSDDDVAVKREQMRSFFTETGVYERAGEMSSDFISRAKDSLSVFSGDHKGNMEQFTDLVLNRTH